MRAEAELHEPFVELVRGHAEVEQHSVHTLSVLGEVRTEGAAEDRGKVPEIRTVAHETGGARSTL